jgi:hypothetical protein
MRGERERREIYPCFILISFANFLADFCRDYLSSVKLQEQRRELESTLHALTKDKEECVRWAFIEP